MTRIALLFLLPAVALAAPVPKAGKGENKVYVTIDGRVVKMNPDGTKQEKLFDDEHAGGDMRVAPDGKRVAYFKRPKPSEKGEIGVREAGGEPKPLLTFDRRPDLIWSADSKTLYGHEYDPGTKPPPPYEECWKNWSIDIATGKQTDLDVPAHFCVWAMKPDGKGFYYFGANGSQPTGPGTGHIRTEMVIDVTKPEPKVLIPADLCVRPLAAFPDGKRWVVKRIHKCEWGVYTAGEKDVALWNVEGYCWPDGVAVSPDGKRVAYAIDVAGKGAREREIHLCTADGDGTNSVTILKTDKYIRYIDWR
jgi:hypothetical protein